MILPEARTTNHEPRCAAFTFIELLITLAIIAICFVPLMRMFSVSLEQLYISRDLTTARYLIQEGMEKVKNSGSSEYQIKDLGDIWHPALDQPPLDLNGKKWRVLRKVYDQTDPLEVRIQVFEEHLRKGTGEYSKPVAEMVTLIEDLDWH